MFLASQEIEPQEVRPQELQSQEVRPQDDSIIYLPALIESLNNRGNPWVAGNTSVSHLSAEEKQKLCGMEFCFEQDKSIVINIPPVDTTLPKPPAEWDWRNRNGKNWMTPVKSQQDCSNCYLMATVGGFEARLKISNNTPDVNIDLSEAFPLSCDFRNYACHGGRLYASALFTVERGLPPEECFPFRGRVLPCINVCPEWEELAIKANGWGGTNCVQEYKARIMEGPMACWLSPKEDFFYYKGGVYTPVMGEKYVHSVTLCGLSDSLGAWLYKNSWGTGWGEQGYGWLNYGEEYLVGPGTLIWLKIETKQQYNDLNAEKISSDIEYINISPNPAYSNLTNAGKMWISFKVDKISRVYITMYDITGKLIKCLEDRELQAGNYRVECTDTDAKGNSLSHGVYFFKINIDGTSYVKKALIL